MIQLNTPATVLVLRAIRLGGKQQIYRYIFDFSHESQVPSLNYNTNHDTNEMNNDYTVLLPQSQLRKKCPRLYTQGITSVETKTLAGYGP
jgi:hypothetical protein